MSIIRGQENKYIYPERFREKNLGFKNISCRKEE